MTHTLVCPHCQSDLDATHNYDYCPECSRSIVSIDKRYQAVEGEEEDPLVGGISKDDDTVVTAEHAQQVTEPPDEFPGFGDDADTSDELPEFPDETLGDALAEVASQDLGNDDVDDKVDSEEEIGVGEVDDGELTEEDQQIVNALHFNPEFDGENDQALEDGGLSSDLTDGDDTDVDLQPELEEDTVVEPEVAEVHEEVLEVEPVAGELEVPVGESDASEDVTRVEENVDVSNALVEAEERASVRDRMVEENDRRMRMQEMQTKIDEAEAQIRKAEDDRVQAENARIQSMEDHLNELQRLAKEAEIQARAEVDALKNQKQEAELRAKQVAEALVKQEEVHAKQAEADARENVLKEVDDVPVEKDDDKSRWWMATPLVAAVGALVFVIFYGSSF